MIDTTVFWAVGILAGGIIVQRIVLRVLAQRHIVQSYAHDIHDILTNEEHQVKGRFE